MNEKSRRLKFLVGGSSGLVGTALASSLKADGHDVVPLIRQAGAGVRWKSADYVFDDPAELEGFDAVIHLGGVSIVGRWTTKKKQLIQESRERSTHALASALAARKQKPGVLIVASAVGFYGDRDNEELTEASAPGTGFLADVCKAWEAAADPARDAGIRVVHVRFGMVLSPEGGALKAMLPAFKSGLGGRVGSGQQYISWASLDDTVGAIRHALHSDDLKGPVNIVSPSPCTNLEFAKALGAALSRPTACPVPAFAIRLLFGEMADALLLASQRVVPQKLMESGYTFRHTHIGNALRDILV